MYVNGFSIRWAVVGFSFLFFTLLTLKTLGGLPPSSQTNSWSLPLSYECLASLVRFLPVFLNLNYPFCLLPLGFYLFLFYRPFFTSHSMAGCVAGWLDAGGLFSFFSWFLISPSPHISIPIYSLCLPGPPILSPVLLLAVKLFIRLSGILDGQSSTVSQS